MSRSSEKPDKLPAVAISSIVSHQFESFRCKHLQASSITKLSSFEHSINQNKLLLANSNYHSILEDGERWTKAKAAPAACVHRPTEAFGVN